MDTSSTHDSLDSIAVVGLAGRFPKARNLDEFWQNLRNGVEGISFFTDEELEATGLDPKIIKNPNYVKAGGMLEDLDLFDASFFGYTPREAEAMDPQHRVFLEVAWEALENAGYDPDRYEGAIGVYAGISMNSYLMHNLFSNPDLLGSLGYFQIMITNDKDFLSTNVSYKFNLKGPSVVVQTACSTSLVAICHACQSLLNYSSDMVLAGGVSGTMVQKAGYMYQPGMIASPDGHCRTFDAKAKGTVVGNGVGIVALKRLGDALEDGDTIHAVIKGTGLNNDGSLKVGFTAPSVEGQAEVIAMAQAVGEVDPETISYIEAHGTATELGDPIEISALTRAFRMETDKKQYCAIGSVKSNIGHLDAAAGVAGFIKTVLALENKEIPPSLHFEKPNPKIDFENSPFYVNNKLSEWKTNGGPRRAGVSSFGIGGTNAHVVLEEAPALETTKSQKPAHLLLLSAKTATALDSATENLATFLKDNADANLADVAYTLQVGRKQFKHRRMLVCRDKEDAINALESRDPKRIVSGFHDAGNPAMAFMFPGQGAQYVNMGKDLYDNEPRFRETVDRCCELLQPHLGFDLRDWLYPSDDKTDEATEKLKQTAVTQPALFVIEYAMSQLWMAWGIRPQAMIGHSIGEYVAACLAGVMSLEDALALVAVRGRLMQQQPSGAMLAVSLSAAEVEPHLNGHVTVAAVNAPTLCVVSGAHSEIDKLHEQLTEKGIQVRKLHTSHAFHSEMMDDILQPFAEQVGKIKLSAPKIPFISNVTGTWITATEATDPQYWAKHLRQAVRFSEGAQELLKEPSRILLEVGPGKTLSALSNMVLVELRKQSENAGQQSIVSSMRHPDYKQSDIDFTLNTLGRLWIAGTDTDWSEFYAGEKRRRIPVPTYPFERERYWVEPNVNGTHAVSERPTTISKKSDVADWFYVPTWKQSVSPAYLESNLLNDSKACWLIFADADGFGEHLAEFLKKAKQNLVIVHVGDSFTRPYDREYTIDPNNYDDFGSLFKDLRVQDLTPERIVYLWGAESTHGIDNLEQAKLLNFYSLLYITRALGKQFMKSSPEIIAVTKNLHQVGGDESLRPEKAPLLGLCNVIPQEYPNIRCRSLDISGGVAKEWAEGELELLMKELTAKSPDLVVAHRGRQRWSHVFEAIRLSESEEEPRLLRQEGVYLVTGGLGRIGLLFAEYLARAAKARLILTSRSGLPPREEWEQWLTSHDETDATSQKIKSIQTLEDLGAEVLVASADAGNLEQMQKVVKQGLERFGEIHGVIHGAGVLDDKSFNSIIQEAGKGECETQFRPKLDGVMILDELFEDGKLDFCFLLSSISSMLGGLGFVAYSSANLFLDAFARLKNQSGETPWFAVNWDAWNFTQSDEGQADPALELAITPSEGVDAFRRILATNTGGQIVVSTGDLQARIDKWIKLESLRPKSQEDKAGKTESAAGHTRPDLQTEYTAPTNEVEEGIAEIWQGVFGVNQVGIHDNFFELGGHSLMATGLVSRLRDAFQVEITLHDFFDKPTVAELAELVLEKLVDQEDSDTLNQLLEEIEGQSADEA